MTTIHIQLDDATYEKAKRAAEASGRTVEQLAADAIAEKAAGLRTPDPFFGWLADEPQLADAIDQAIARSRRERYGQKRASDDR